MSKSLLIVVGGIAPVLLGLASMGHAAGAVQRVPAEASACVLGPAVSGAIPLVGCDPRTRISTLPYTIAAPGSYIVVRDLSLSSAGDGITVLSSDVTIDLLGFTLNGTFAGGNGIVVPSAVKNVAILNGTIRQWTSFGIDVRNVQGGRIEGLNIDQNSLSTLGSAGVGTGTSIVVSRCTFSANGQCGVLVGANCIVADCAVDHTGAVLGTSGDGMRVGGRSFVRDCSLMRNDGAGIISEGLGQIEGNHLIENGLGIHVVANGARVDGNHCFNNQYYGLLCDPDVTHAAIVRNFVGETTSGPNYDMPSLPGIGPVQPASTGTSPWANIEY